MAGADLKHILSLAGGSVSPAAAFAFSQKASGSAPADRDLR